MSNGKSKSEFIFGTACISMCIHVDIFKNIYIEEWYVTKMVLINVHLSPSFIFRTCIMLFMDFF